MEHSEAALRRLGRMVSATQEPVLDATALQDLLDMYAVTDASGALPGSGSYLPSYDWYGAAAEGWRWKEAEAAHQVTFNADGSSFNLSDITAHCQAMVAKYESLRQTGSITTQ